jgi:ribosomal protein L40E
MKHRVELWVSGKTFIFECYARNPQEAKQVAQAQYPNARILRANPTHI